jgi:hypothetical protein
LIFFSGEAALLLWLHWVLLRPGVKPLFEARRCEGARWLEWVVVVGLMFFSLAWIPTEARRRQQSLNGAAPETWSPALAPGEKPDLMKIRNEAKTLAGQALYEEALQRQIWYFNHALEYEPAQVGVRLSFALSDWVELGRTYPKARQVLVQIRDHDMQLLNLTMPYSPWLQDISSAIPGFSRASRQNRFALFQDIYCINIYLRDDGANRELTKTLVANDPRLAQRMGYKIGDDAFDALVKRAANGAASGDVGDGQAAFGAIRKQWEFLRGSEVRLANLHEQGRKKMDEYWAQKGQKPPSMMPQRGLPKAADKIFIDKSCQLIELLVANGHQAYAQKVRDQAVALLDDPRLKSAVTDAEEKLRSAPGGTPEAK